MLKGRPEGRPLLFYFSTFPLLSLFHLVIDCHGHYTTAPKQLQAFRDEQIAALKDPTAAAPKTLTSITDDQLRESVQPQLKFQTDRGTDVTIFSPRASAMAHHIGDATTSLDWTRHCNDLIHRVCTLFPENFVGVCQLPQTPGAPLANCKIGRASCRAGGEARAAAHAHTVKGARTGG